MSPPTAGHVVVRQLERNGVERAYVVPGESYLEVLDGLHDSPITTVVCRQEGGAAYAAVAEGRLTGRPGIAMVTRGPGAANAMIAVHTAWQDATPLVLLVGLIPTGQRGREAFQEFDLAGWCGSTAKAVLTLEDPREAATLVADAVHLAAAGRPGPVVVGLPEDVLSAPCPVDTVAPRALADPSPTGEDLDALGELVAAARRPVVVVGGDRWGVEASGDLAAWAEADAIPVLADFRAYDAIDHDSAAYAGSLGYGGSPHAAALRDEADLQIWLGTVRGDVATASWTRGADVPAVVVGTDPDAHGHYGRLDRLVLATPATFTAAVRKRPLHPAPERARMDAAHRAHRGWATPLPDGTARGVDLGTAMAVLRRHLPADTIVTYGAGNHTHWPHRFLPAHRPGTLLGPRNGAMGFGVPAAVAAGLVHPGRTVLSVAGDGCFGMNGQELATAVGYGVRMRVLLVDNGCYATIRGHQEREHPGRPIGTGLTNPDYAALARAHGAFGETVADTAAFEPALLRALDAPGPALLHLPVDPATRGPAAAGEPG